MMTPLRIEYLANPVYGLALTPQEIALLVAIIPALVRLVLSPAWGWLFDRMNFFVLRITINLTFAASIIVFFTGDSWAGLILGAIVFGIAISGGDVAWACGSPSSPRPSRRRLHVGPLSSGVLVSLLAFQPGGDRLDCHHG